MSRKLFFLLILFLPSQIGRHFWPQSFLVSGIRIDYLAPTIYFTDLIILGILVSFLFEQRKKLSLLKKLLSAKYMIPLFLLLFFIINIFSSSFRLIAFYKSLKIIEFIFLGFYIVKSKIKLPSLLIPLALGVLFSSILGLAQLIKQSSLNGLFYFFGERTFTASTPGISLIDISGRLLLRPYAAFPHPNVLGGFLSIALIFIFFFFKTMKKNISYVGFFLFVLLFGVISLLTTFSLSSNLAFMTSFILLIIAHPKTFLFKLKPLFIFLPLFLLVFVLFLTKVYSVNFLNDSALRIRLDLEAVSLWLQNPYIGIGLNNFIPLSHISSESLFFFRQPVHNIYLLVLAETGFIGFFTFIFLILSSLKRSLKLWRQKIYLPLLLLIQVLLIGFVDHYFLTLQQGQILLVLVFSLAFLPKSSYT